MVITIFAVIGILVFAGVSLPHFKIENITNNASIGGIQGVLAALPFAIWFFLGIECLSNVAEESENPQRDLGKGFGSSLVTLIILCILVFVASIGLGGWEKVVYNKHNQLSDSPLPLALSLIYEPNHWVYQTIICVGILGLIASFHGGLLAGGRVTLETGRSGFAPKILGKVNERFKTPAFALILNMFLGLLVIFTGKTGEIITLACFGVLVLYIFSMASLLKLRRSEPNLNRPFKVPIYPTMPILALILCSICFLAIAYFNFTLLIIFFSFLIVSFTIFKLTKS